jgi:hypothetical protein
MLIYNKKFLLLPLTLNIQPNIDITGKMINASCVTLELRKQLSTSSLYAPLQEGAGRP